MFLGSAMSGFSLAYSAYTAIICAADTHYPAFDGNNNLFLSNYLLCPHWGFRGNSAGKESTCIAGDPSSIPRSGRSPGEGIGYPFKYSWASLVAQTVKNLPAMWEICIWSLGWEDPLQEGLATHSSVLAWRIPWTEEPGGLQSMGLQRVGHNWATKHMPPFRQYYLKTSCFYSKGIVWGPFHKIGFQAHKMPPNWQSAEK